MQRIDAVIIGAGQSGLAMSHCLTGFGIDHIVFERGRIAEHWRSATWRSLRLLTPNWMSRLPGWHYAGSVSDGFMSKQELVSYLDDYATSFQAPVLSDAAVQSVYAKGDRYRVITSRGAWESRVVIIATGECQHSITAAMANRLSPAVFQLTASNYGSADALPRGGVLVVGASASGAQIADEIHRSGRPVTLAVGRHTRLPRRYRGRDIMAWMDLAGVFDESAAEVADLDRARRQPSLQVVGSAEGRAVDLPSLRAQGVRLVGRLAAIDGVKLSFVGDLAEITWHAEQKLARLLAKIDQVIAARRLEAPLAEPIAPSLFAVPPLRLDAMKADIRTIIWATGYRRAYPWLHLPLLDSRGELLHDGGIMPAPGLYALGLRFMRRRKSNFIDGVGRDAEELAAHIAGYLGVGSHLAA